MLYLLKSLNCTRMKTNICPENGWLEDQLAFQTGPFSGLQCISPSLPQAPLSDTRHGFMTPGEGFVLYPLYTTSRLMECRIYKNTWEKPPQFGTWGTWYPIFFWRFGVFFCHYSSSIPWFDSTISVPFEPPYSAAPFFQRVSCRNSDAGCTYQSSSKLQLPPGWLRGHLAIHSEVSQNFNERNCMNCQVVPGERKVRNLLLASPGIFVFQSWKLAEAFGWLCWHGTENRLLTMGHRFACESSSWDAFKQSFGERVGNPEAPPPRQANRSCPLRFLPFRHRQNVTGSDEFAGWEM